MKRFADISGTNQMIDDIFHGFQKLYQLYGSLLEHCFTWKLAPKKLTVDQTEAEH